MLQITAERLTHENWAPYGDLIQGTEDPKTMPSAVVTNTITANPIKGYKFNRISPIISTYPDPSSPSAASSSPPITSISLIRIGPPEGLVHGGTFDVKMLERHSATSQAFIPLAKAGKEWEKFTGEKSLEQDVGGMLVVGCLNGKDDQPDFSTLKVFVASPSQGVCYHRGIWHHSVVCFSHCDLAAVDTQITTDVSLKIDCEIVRSEVGGDPFARVQLPKI